jgi:phosphoribosylformylglycinamidine cyclo-ligase
MDYRSAGVDLERGDRAKAGLKDLLGSTSDALTLSKLGTFGGLYAVPPEVTDPVLVSSADGVGTKLKVAFAAGEHGTVGRDLVNHCVNDILVQGAKPLFFLDYLATGILDECVVHEVVAGVARGCKENGCALLGGETAQMPGFYAAGEYDLAGFIVGIVSRDRILDGSRVRAGDALVGLSSSGLHTNGYSLARQILFEAAGLGVTDRFPGLEETVATALLRVHRSYLGVLWPELEAGTVSAIAHITGGGIPGNLPRSLPEGLGAEIDRSSWEVPPLFRALRELGSVDEDEMFRVFNMGVGMVVVLPSAGAGPFVRRLATRGEEAWELGQIVDRPGVHFE